MSISLDDLATSLCLQRESIDEGERTHVCTIDKIPILLLDLGYLEKIGDTFCRGTEPLSEGESVEGLAEAWIGLAEENVEAVEPMMMEQELRKKCEWTLRRIASAVPKRASASLSAKSVKEEAGSQRSLGPR